MNILLADQLYHCWPFIRKYPNLLADWLCCQFESPTIFCWLTSYTIVCLSLESTYPNLPADGLCCQFESPTIFCWLTSYTIVGLSVESALICRLTGYAVSLNHQQYSAG